MGHDIRNILKPLGLVAVPGGVVVIDEKRYKEAQRLFGKDLPLLVNGMVGGAPQILGADRFVVIQEVTVK